nr:hypothetical protein [Tanacetum cinerariifolium]
AAKGKQPARATTPTEPTDVERTEAKQLKIVLKRSRQETHISQQRSSSTDEGTGSRPGVPDVSSGDSEEELSWNSFDDEDVDEQTKDDEDDDNNEEDQGLRIGEDERMQEEEDTEELYHDVDINQGRGLQISQETEDTHRRREDDDQEGPSAGPDWGSKRQREGEEHASASIPSEPATESAGRSTTGSQSRKLSASKSAFAEEPVQPTCQIEEPSHPVFETGADDQPIIQTT